MTMVDFMCYLRIALVKAKQENDDPTITQIFGALLLLRDASLVSLSVTQGFLYVVDELINAIQHFHTAEFKVNIPTEDEIRSHLELS